MEQRPIVVDSVKKFHMLMPSNRTNGKVSVPSEKRRNFTNTTYMTQKSIKGLRTDHAMPRKDPW